MKYLLCGTGEELPRFIMGPIEALKITYVYNGWHIISYMTVPYTCSHPEGDRIWNCQRFPRFDGDNLGHVHILSPEIVVS